jgi:histidinol-phosphate aminotransferase
MVIRTFSKAFGLAGVRLGYLLARPGIIKVMDKVKLPFSLGFFPQVCGAELLRDPRLVRQSAAQIVRDRRNVMKELKRLKRVRAIPSRANFILFQVRGMPAPRVFAGLRKQGVLIRAFDAPRLDQWLRVTIGRPGENKKFLLALKKILGAS